MALNICKNIFLLQTQFQGKSFFLIAENNSGFIVSWNE